MVEEPLENPLALGARTDVAGETYIISEYVDLHSLIGIRVSDGKRVRLSIADILAAINASASRAKSDAPSVQSSGFELLREEHKAVIEQRAAALTTLIASKTPSRALAEETAQNLGVDVATIYRWRKKYLETGDKRVLAPHIPNGGRGKSRLDENVEAIIQRVIDEAILDENRMSPYRAMETIKQRCRRARVVVPHLNTLYRRIKSIHPKKRTRAREGEEASRRYEAFPGEFPGADYPNAVWQIDHTPLDIDLVDDVYGLNIRRPWLTLAIDVYRRCVVGMYPSLDPPNAVSVGMCIVNAILPKQGWLAAHGLTVPWPMYGKPVAVHADNDSTFKCASVTESCSANHIRMEWRAVGKPNWGGHIERLLGTVNREIHTLPGTTFSNTTERGEYQSHKKAAFTFNRVERYVADFICGIYHQRKHSTLGRPPIGRYEDGLLGDGTAIGPGLPRPISDPERLRLDFLPFDSRTVQQYGIVIEKITYYAPVLDRWVRAVDPNDSRRARKFLVRYDKRDISYIYFLDPELDRYFKIPYARAEHPSLTAWELEDVRKQLRKEGCDEVDEDLIFETFERLERLREEAQASTSAARRRTQRKKVAKSRQEMETAQVKAATPDLGSEEVSGRAASPVGLDDEEEILPFDTVEVGVRR